MMEVKVSDPKNDRGKWANKTEFLLSCLGYAIGIGNVCRFPYMCYRSGGGAFLVPYLLMLFTCGIPLFFMETSLGQFSSTGILTLFKISPLFKGVGYAIMVVNLIVSSYFSTIIAYPVLYLTYCFEQHLPWSHCNNPWNTKNCTEVSEFINSGNITVNITQGSNKTPADEFFHRQLLKISDSIEQTGSIVWPLFYCNTFTWIVVYLCMMKGVKSVGKAVYFTATFPFFILLVLFVRGITLPGAWKGIQFYIYPQWHQLSNLKIWADAAHQIFFSLGPGWGGIITMASYNPFRNNVQRDSILIPIVNCGTSIFAGFVVFSVLGFMSHRTGLPVSSVATGGPGLAFITYPEAIAMLPYPQFWAVMFFLMLFFLGLDSQFVQIEALISAILDEYPALRRKKALSSFILCFAMMVISTIFITNSGMYWLQLFDWYSGSISIIFICLLEIIIVGWVYGYGDFIRDIEYMMQQRISCFWKISWGFTNPLILAILFMTTFLYTRTISYNGTAYPDWAINIGWTSCAVSLLCIPYYMFYKLLYLEEGDFVERLKRSAKSTNDWGPANRTDFLDWFRAIKVERIKARSSISLDKKTIDALDTTPI